MKSQQYLYGLNPFRQIMLLFLFAGFQAVAQNHSTKAELLVQRGEVYFTEGKIDSAQKALEQALQIHENHFVLDADAEARVNYLLGNIHRLKSQYADAVQYYETGISISVENGLKQREASLLNSLGGLYVEIEEYEKGLEYCKRGLAIYQKYFPDREADICLFFTNIGNISNEMGDYKQAQVYLNQAKKMNDKIQNDYYSSLIYSGLGVSALKGKKYDEALRFLNTALEHSIAAENPHSEVAILANKGQVYLETKDYESAEKELIKAYDKTKQIGDKYLRKQLLTSLIELYSKSEQYELAFDYQIQLTALRDSILTKDLIVDLATLELKYQNSQNEKRILELQVQNERQSFMLRRNQYQMIIGFSLLALIVVTLILVYQRNKSRNEAKIHQFENKMFRLQIKPHFIFNVLSSIQGFMNSNDSKQASVYLSKFARLIRNVLEQSRKDFITINKEIQNLKYYLELQQLRYEECFEFELNVDANVDPDIILIPPMLVQPIVENAVEHGVIRETNENIIKVHFRKDNDHLIVIIEDNGRGYPIEIDEGEKTNADKESLSTQMIKEQMAYFNEQLSGEFSIQFEHVWPNDKNKGTRVTLRIPYIQQKANN